MFSGVASSAKTDWNWDRYPSIPPSRAATSAVPGFPALPGASSNRHMPAAAGSRADAVPSQKSLPW
jgi:hypothetical protein